MAGPLGVSHLLLFSRSSSGNVNLRIAITPRGPTLHFRVENYSLCKDIVKSLRHPVAGSKAQYLNPPLLVMNNFTSTSTNPSSDQTGVPKHLESLITTVFQSLFPPISPQSVPLTSIRRVLLLDRISPSTPTPDQPPYTVYLRHYHITTKVTGLPKSLRRLERVERAIAGDKKLKSSRIPNLGQREDVADYFLGDRDKGYVSASETEVESEAEVEYLAPQVKKVLSRKERDAARANAGLDGSEPGRQGAGVEKRAVKLTELGPRMNLRLTKVEDGLCSGKVLWHEFVHKTKEEEKAMDAVWEKRNAEKAERRRIQKENVERKRAERKAKGGKDGEGEEDEEGFDEEEADLMDWDDDQWQSDDENGDGASDADDGEDGDVALEVG
jgi:ribosome biogenesis protein SSF1/2